MFFAQNNIYSAINTNRLILREPRFTDIDDVFAICKEPNSCRYADWLPHRSKYDTKAYINWLKKQSKREQSGSYTWFAELKDIGRVIATLSVVETDSSGLIATVGYTFATDYQHKGYATEALTALIKYLFLEKGFKRIQAKVMVQNTPSIRLLERVGMKREGLLRRGAFCKSDCVDVYLYAMTVEDFCGLNSSVSKSSVEQTTISVG